MRGWKKKEEEEEEGSVEKINFILIWSYLSGCWGFIGSGKNISDHQSSLICCQPANISSDKKK